MITYDEMIELLDEIACTFPKEFFNDLNGGIVLRRETKKHPDYKSSDLYVLGEYHKDPYGLGRFIAVYYGSFIQVYGTCNRNAQKRELARIVRHEFTHHIEELAGERGLEIKDRLELGKYE